MNARLDATALFFGVSLLLASASVASAGLFYDEDVTGDLSNFGSAPTVLDFTLGVNRVTGTMGGPPDADPDIITFTIQPGQFLSSIYLEPLDPAERSFYAIAAGSTINMTDGTTHLGNYLTYQFGELITELSFGGEFGGTGFTAPLGAGAYTAWIQEISTRTDYTLAYTVVPETAAYPALAGALALAAALLRRRRHTSE
jgi:MYXO-CTERM domain-containing protein